MAFNFFSTCKECESSCCKGARPPITSKRRKVIERFIRENNLDIKEPFIVATYVFPREISTGYCVFLGKDSKCVVHKVKPETCVAGPITFDIDFSSNEIIYYLKKTSICPLAGYLFAYKMLLAQHLRQAKESIRQLIRDMNRNELLEVLKIEEPETFKIEEENLELTEVRCSA